MTRIFAVDPGSEPKKNAMHSTAGTGFCLIKFTPTTAPELLAWGEVLGGPDKVIPLLGKVDPAWAKPEEVAFYISNRRADIRMIEGFTMRIATANPNPLQTIGAMKLQSVLDGIPLHVPQPSQRTEVDMDGLRTLGLYRAGGNGHFREAIRHVVSWLIRENHMPTMTALQPPDYEEI